MLNWTRINEFEVCAYGKVYLYLIIKNSRLYYKEAAQENNPGYFLNLVYGDFNNLESAKQVAEIIESDGFIE